MASETVRDDRSLVALYAGRLGGRDAVMVESAPRALRVAPGVHQFGRRAARTRRSRAHRGGAVSALVATALLVGTQTAAAAQTHVVQPGDTLSGIASEYQVSVQHIASLNGITNPNLIQVGSTLTIVPSAPGSPAATAQEVTIGPGDTLAGIAAQYGMTVNSLAQLNGLTNPNLIIAGGQLAVPNLSPSSTQPATTSGTTGSVPLHLVVAGETLGQIAAQHGITVAALSQANGITDPNQIQVGQLLRIPGAATIGNNGLVELRGMPVQRQSLPLSCEAAALSIATAYWGNQVSEWVFIENMPYNANPHLGFRGSMTGAFGGTTDYGVYPEPLVPMLNQYGFNGDVFYANGNADLLKQQIKAGHPVIAWITNMTSAQTRSYQWVNGQRFALVPQEHAVVVYGYDANGVYVADPGDGSYRTFDWADFMRSWGYFNGMSLAVYPQAN